jgi:hypothetical protein
MFFVICVAIKRFIELFKYLNMLYQKQKSNPRSPLTVIRNQIKNNLQTSSSRSISRSPSYSPVSRTLKCASKDYSSYIPVRSLSKVENSKPNATNHLELKSKRKILCSQSKKLEEKLKEIKTKVENQVKTIRNHQKSIPRCHRSLICEKIKRILASKIKLSLNYSLEKIKFKAFSEESTEIKADTYYKKLLKQKYMKILKNNLEPLILNRRKQFEIAKRHYRLQILLVALTKWQEFYNLRNLKPEDISCIEEMDTLLESFVHDTHSQSQFHSFSMTPHKLTFSENSPNISKLTIPETFDFDSSALFSFREQDVSELEVIAVHHYQASLLVTFM